ncbi:MAG: T9SS type A sorting domain-containing protein [Bacteroidales bacterium]|nr:T9SS type A sorting domain-containing protein [Bacteroidales bacterium]
MKTKLLTFFFLFSFGCLNAQDSDSLSNNYFFITGYYDNYFDSIKPIYDDSVLNNLGYKDYLRWKSFMSTRYGKYGNIGDYYKNIDTYFKTSGGNFNPENTDGDWAFLGPFGVPQKPNGVWTGQTGKGWINQVYVNPANHDQIYAGAHNSGVWYTDNGGESWICLTENYPQITGIESIVFHPNNPQIIYIATASQRRSSAVGYSNGVYVTYNGGNSWQEMQIFVDGNSEPFFPSYGYQTIPIKFAFHPNNPDIMFLITQSYILKSENGGITWQQKYFGNFWIWGIDNNHPIGWQWGFNDFAFDYNNPDIVFATGHIILKSIDGGETWDDPVNDITQEITDESQVGITKISTHPNFPGKSWIIYQEEPNVSPSANNYIVLYDVNAGVVFKDGVGGFSKYKGHIEVSPNDMNTVYYSGLIMLQYTKDDLLPVGEYHPISTGNVSYGNSAWIHVDVRDLDVLTDSYGNDKLYVGNDGSINWGTFTGNNGYYWDWTFIGDDPVGAEKDGLNVTEFHAFGVSKTDPDIIVGGAQDLNGFMYNGSNWYQVAAGDGGDAIIDPDNSNIIYQVIPCCGGASIKRTTDGYATSIQFHYFGGSIFMDCPIYFKPNDPNTVYSGFENLYRFDNARTTVDKVNLNLPNSYGTNAYHAISDIAINKYNPDILLVSTDNYTPLWAGYGGFEKSLFKSNDGGQTWVDLSVNIGNGLYGGFIRDIEINPDNENEIWVSFGLATTYETNDEYTRKIYRSTDGGINWQSYVAGFPEAIPVSDLEYDNVNKTLYLASDIGVFYRPDNAPEWIPYNFNMPYSRVYEVEINEAANKIFAGTYGRGIWESELAHQCPPSSGEPFIVEENTTLSGSHRYHRDIIVKSGFELTITGSLYMGYYNKIVVEQGAKIIVDGATISNSCDGDMWYGIEIWGTLNQSQFPSLGYQGFAVLKNGARIVNAQIGVSTIKETGGEYDYDYAGGIIKVNDAVFVDNIVAVKMFPYEHFNPNNPSEIYNNLSSFTNCSVFKNGTNNTDYFMEFQRIRGVKLEECTITTNLSFPEGTVQGNAMVKLDNCNNFNFVGCYFGNTRYAGYLATIPDFGTAIYSFASSFVIKEKCYEYPPPECSEYKPTVFEKMYYGIKAYNNSHDGGIAISKSEFIKNYRGVYLSGISYPAITQNYIQVSHTIATPYVAAYGVYLDRCNGYKVEENEFECYLNQTFYNIAGIVVNNSGSEYNEIYKNSFFKIQVAILAQNNNRGSEINPTSGLKVKCNDFDNNKYDIAVTSDGQTEPAGVSRFQGFSIDPSGNLFSKNFAGIYGDYNNEEMFVLYYHHDPDSEPRVYPEDYSSKTISRENTLIPYSEESCPSQLDPGGGTGTDGLRSEMESSSSNEESVSVLLAGYIDGGNTDAMANEVVLSTPPEAWDMYTELLSGSPYLSDTVMKESVQKENVLSDVMVRDVLVANPQSAKSEKVMEAVEERSAPLPDYMIGQIEQGRKTVSAKEQLEAEKSYWGHKYQMARNNLIRFYLSDSIPGGNYDSIVGILQNLTDVNSKYELALLFLYNGDFINMENTLNSISGTVAKHQDYLSYTGVVKESLETNTGFDDMTSQQIAVLTNLADYSNSEVKAFARNILLETGQFDYDEPVILPVEGLKSAEITDDKRSEGNSSFRLYPNPAQNYFTIEYDSPLYAKNIFIELSDMTGKRIFTQNLSPGRDKKVISTENISAGVYLVKFVIDGKTLAADKLTIN